jgi:hypothetical protein
MIIAVNFLSPTLPCALQDYLRHSLLVKHIAGYLALYFFVVITLRNNRLHFGIWSSKLFQTAVLYICFIISSRCDPRFLSVFIVFLAIDFFIYTYYSEKQTHPNYVKTVFEERMFKIADTFGVISLIGLALGFSLALYNKKKTVSVFHFLFGNAKC